MTIFETLPAHQQELIKRHLDLVIEANKTTNLTRIDTPDKAMLLHVEDSLLALPEINDAPNGRYGDLGTGGGYPGIPLAIVTGRPTTLIDSRQKKTVILDGIIGALELHDQVSTYAGRAELLARKQPGNYAVLTARALAKLPVLLELASPLLKQGGILICYKAQLEDEELAHAKRIKKQTGMTLQTDRSITLGEDITRRILTFKKTATPTISLPRKEGEAQKSPLS